MEELNVSNVSASELDENDGILTMVDVLEQENELEAEADAVLGGVDDKSCTYAQGQLARQPLYACKTCCKERPGGVCLACSYKCHEGHELFELYTKRNFRCDCGNDAFIGNKCLLDPIKDRQNSGNAYNQNFQGMYCTCARPYPDPEDNVEDDMIQCSVCEDWFHSRHIESKSPLPDDFAELICQLCMEKLPFLRNYGHLGSQCNVTSEKLGDTSIDVVTPDEPSRSVSESTLNLKDEINSPICKLVGVVGEAVKEATFWPAGWRALLCRCPPCLQLYNIHKVSFLINDEDTVKSYEKNIARKGGETQFELGMRALSNLDRVKQIDAIQSYNEMKVALMEHLTKFKESKRVVTESDIHEFFDQMKAKRPRVEIQSNCR